MVTSRGEREAEMREELSSREQKENYREKKVRSRGRKEGRKEGRTGNTQKGGREGSKLARNVIRVNMQNQIKRNEWIGYLFDDIHM